MTTKIICSMLLAFFASISFVNAAEHSAARIDLAIKNGKLEFKASEDKATNIYYAHWVKDEAQKVQRVCAEKKVSGDQWTQMTFTVTASEDTTMAIAIKGRYSKTLKNWVYFDDVTSEGADKPIKNGGFEETGSWSFPKGQQVLDESLAHTGKGAVLVWHDKGAFQNIQLKAGQPVTITAWVKFCKQEEKESK
jgi:hypothetical protein